MLTKIEKELGILLKSRDANRDSCIGVLLTLETEDNFKLMLRWIKKNPKAGQTEILRHLRRAFMEKITYYVPYTRPRTLKKIAVF